MPVFAQISAKTLEERLKAIDAKALTPEDCASQLATVANANAPELIYAGRVCEAVGSLVESSFLFAAGQLRAMTDVMLLPPATQSDDQSLLPLYGMLYYGGGAAGIKDEVLRDPVERQRFLSLLEQWRPSYSETYDPGWNARKRPDASKYQSTVTEVRAGLRKQFDRTIRLVSDDEYYSLHRQFMDILERHPDGLPAESAEGKIADGLQRRIKERMVALGEDVGPSAEELRDGASAEESLAEMRVNFPPYSPEKDEVIIASAAGPVVERCLDLGERHAVSEGGKIARVLVTSSKKWGLIWRADITGGDLSSTRFTCTETTSSSSSIEVDGQTIPPLPLR